jgi:bifunctional DNA-binding transcriptional regulator/antitoxin component of YhaV-PrlF toxin-antitoxin module
MVIRKLSLFNSILGFTIPKEYAYALNLKKGDYVQVYLGKNKSLIVLKREENFVKINRLSDEIQERDEQQYAEETR